MPITWSKQLTKFFISLAVIASIVCCCSINAVPWFKIYGGVGGATAITNARSITFNGSTQAVSVPYQAFNASDQLSITFWVKFASTTSAMSLIDGYFAGGVDRVWAIDHLGGAGHVWRFYASTDGTGRDKDFRSSIVIDTNTWHQIVITYDAGAIKLYVDGSEDLSVTVDTDDSSTTLQTGGTNPFRFASSPHDVIYLNGLMDWITIFDTTILSAANVTTFYNAGTPIDPRFTTLAGTVRGFWPLGDIGDSLNTPNGIIDYSGNAYHGTGILLLPGDATTDVP